MVTSYKFLVSLVVGVASIGVGIGASVSIVVGVLTLSLVVVLVALSLVVLLVLSALVMRLCLLDEALLVDINTTNLSFLNAEDGESESVCWESCSSHQSLAHVSFKVS